MIPCGLVFLVEVGALEAEDGCPMAKVGGVFWGLMDEKKNINHRNQKSWSLFSFCFFWIIPAEKKEKKLESPDLQSPMDLCRAESM